MNTIPLYRPVGQRELELIAESGFSAFPPRLPEQPIFYPVLNEAYATQIARDWNTPDPASNYVGYVTRFYVDAAFLSRYDVKTVGAAGTHEEYWIPANDLPEFNAAITNNSRLLDGIDVIARFRGPNAPPIAIIDLVGTPEDAAYSCRLTDVEPTPEDIDALNRLGYFAPLTAPSPLPANEYNGSDEQYLGGHANRVFTADSEDIAEQGIRELFRCIHPFLRWLSSPTRLLYDLWDRERDAYIARLDDTEYVIYGRGEYEWDRVTKRTIQAINHSFAIRGIPDRLYFTGGGNDAMVAILTPEIRDMCVAAGLMRNTSEGNSKVR